jgi:gliding motility-associated-like protein
MVSSPIVVNEPAALGITSSTTPVTCPGKDDGTASVNVSGGTPNYTYLWSDANTTANDSRMPTGPYTVTVTDNNLCTITTSVTITAIPPMAINPVKKNVLCPPLKNGFIFLNVNSGTPNYTYTWSNGATTDVLTGLAEGNYAVTITDQNGCTKDTAFVVSNDSAFVIDATPDTAVIDLGESVTLNVTATGDNISSLNWRPNYGLTCYDCPDPTASPVKSLPYYVTAISDSGCTSKDTVWITVIPNYQLYVPNAFTPNGDAVNDYWEIFGNKKAWLEMEVNIFNRWGEKVFESNDHNFKWDGTYKGALQNPGVYVYTLNLVFLDGHAERTLKGSVTLIR